MHEAAPPSVLRSVVISQVKMKVTTLFLCLFVLLVSLAASNPQKSKSSAAHIKKHTTKAVTKVAFSGKKHTKKAVHYARFQGGSSSEYCPRKSISTSPNCEDWCNTPAEGPDAEDKEMCNRLCVICKCGCKEGENGCVKKVGGRCP
jgi:hypothetical protein